MKGSEMKLYAKKEECCGCGACADVCPAHAIRMDRDKEGFDYPCADGSACVHCGRCEEVCPLKNHFSGKCSPGFCLIITKVIKILVYSYHIL